MDAKSPPPRGGRGWECLAQGLGSYCVGDQEGEERDSRMAVPLEKSAVFAHVRHAHDEELRCSHCQQLTRMMCVGCAVMVCNECVKEHIRRVEGGEVTRDEAVALAGVASSVDCQDVYARRRARELESGYGRSSVAVATTDGVETLKVGSARKGACV